MTLFEKIKTLETLPNGCKIIAIDHLAEVVLAGNIDKPHIEGGVEYVTWDFYRGDLRSTSNGHYFGADYKEATEDFAKRIITNSRYVQHRVVPEFYMVNEEEG